MPPRPPAEEAAGDSFVAPTPSGLRRGVANCAKPLNESAHGKDCSRTDTVRSYSTTVRAPSISTVIPVFNEEESIAHSLAMVGEALAITTSEYEIIVVDDGSADRSAEIVAQLASRDPRIRLVRNDRNRGYGATVRAGFAVARMELIWILDADLPVDPQDIARAVRVLEVTCVDMIAAYRHDRTSEGLRRTVYSFGYNFLIGVLFGWPHRDLNFCFKLMRREVLDAVELRSDGCLIPAELLVKARNLGFRVQQIGLDYYPRTRGRSTLSSMRTVITILRELVELAPEMRRPRHRVPVGAAVPAAIARLS